MSVILEAFLNTLWQTAAVALLSWAALRWTPRVNAATREAVWWAVLAFVVLLPALRGLPAERAAAREMPAAAVSAPAVFNRLPALPAGDAPRRDTAQVVLPSGSWPTLL